MDSPPTDLDQAIDRFLIHCRVERGYSDKTISSYASDLRLFVQWMEKRERSTINSELITSYVGELNAVRSLAPSTVRRRLASLRSLLKFMVREGILETNPYPSRLRAPATSPIPKALSEEEVERLLEAPNTETILGIRDRALLEVLYATGVRVSECVALKLSDIEMGVGLMRVRGKGGKYRVVPLGDYAVDWLRRYLADSRPQLVRGKRESRVFLGKQGPLSRVQVGRIVKRHALAAGIASPISPHTLRHCCATHMLERGADIAAVQELLGHSSIATVEVYTRVTMKHLREVYTHAHPHAE